MKLPPVSRKSGTFHLYRLVFPLVFRTGRQRLCGYHIQAISKFPFSRDLLLNPSVDELEELGQISGAFRFQNQYLHALHGRVIVLCQIKGIEQKVTKKTFRLGFILFSNFAVLIYPKVKRSILKEKVWRFLKSFQISFIGTPVLLCRIPELTSVSDCIVISCSENQVSLKAKAKKEVNISSSDEFVLIPSVGLGYLIALDEFLVSFWSAE